MSWALGCRAPRESYIALQREKKQPCVVWRYANRVTRNDGKIGTAIL